MKTPVVETQQQIADRFYAFMKNIGFKSQYMVQDKFYMAWPDDETEHAKYGTITLSKRAMEAISTSALAEQKLAEHLKHVGDFLNEMYAIMIDPLADGEMSVTETCSKLLEQAKKDRERMNSLEPK